MLTRRTLPLRNVRFYARTQFPVMLGVMLATAVLTGSLVIGDSLRGSLRDRALRRLAGVEVTYAGTQFVSQSIAAKLPGKVVPALLLDGSVNAVSPGGDPLSLTRIHVVGVDAAGAAFFDLGDAFGTPDKPRAVVSARLAEALQLGVGSKLEVGVERMSNVPRSSLLGAKSLDKVAARVALEVGRVLPADHPANDFDLSPNPRAPVNLFVPLEYLQARVEKPGRVNALLGTGADVAALNAALAKELTPADWALRLQTATKPGTYLSVESEQLVLNPATARAVQTTAESLGARCEPTLSYLANTIALGDAPILGRDVGSGRKFLPYSVVAALNPAAAAPLGPFLPPGVAALADDEIVLLDWPESPLRGLPVGATLTVAYFKPEMEANAEETFARFTLKGYVPLAGAADDPSLTPPFPGITDKLSIGEWESPFEMESKRIQRRDEDYWNRHKTTPKAYISTAAGERLFGSRFGTVTSLRIAPPLGQTPAAFKPALREKLLTTLDPAAAGLVFQPTRERLLTTSRGGTNFGVMFLLFSGLLIGSTLLLVGLLFRLAVERRAREVGLLLATGYTPREVRGIVASEGMLVAFVGVVLGLLVSVGYADRMLQVLIGLWPDAEVGSYLRLHVSIWTPLIGFELTMLTAWLTIRLSLRGLTHVPPPALLRGVSCVGDSGLTLATPTRRPWVVLGLVLVAGVASLAVGPTRANPDERAGAFFTGGLLLLAGGLYALRLFLRRAAGFGAGGLWSLGVRNAARNAARTLLTAALVAGSMFLVVSVESFRRKPDDEFAKPTGGSGGLPLLAEADVPIFQPFDRGAGRDDLLEALGVAYQREEARRSGGPGRTELLARATADLDGLVVYPFRLRGGDDASCLNLSQAGQPRVLGVPDAIVDRGGFRFTQTRAATAEERANPWLLLRKPLDALPDGRVPVPVVAEQNTVFFMLKTTLGGVVEVPDESGRLVPVRIVGMLQDSVFQSDLVMADAPFRSLFPRQEGYRVFLLDAPAEKREAVARLLQLGLRSHGLSVERSADRVATYQAVVGAYLTTFQLLGAFGLLLAVLGLSVVVLRNVTERAGELALLRAVGYRFRDLATMVLAETLFVLAAGLAIGVAAALASVLPNLALGGSVPWPRLAGLLAVTGVTGLVVALVVTFAVARLPIIPALRQD